MDNLTPRKTDVAINLKDKALKSFKRITPIINFVKMLKVCVHQSFHYLKIRTQKR